MSRTDKPLRYVPVTCTILHSTEKAIYVEGTDSKARVVKAWIPKSQCHLTPKQLIDKEEQTIQMADWIVEAKGLAVGESAAPVINKSDHKPFDDIDDDDISF